MYELDPILIKNAYMHEQTTIGIHEEEVPRLVYTLFWGHNMTSFTNFLLTYS